MVFGNMYSFVKCLMCACRDVIVKVLRLPIKFVINACRVVKALPHSVIMHVMLMCKVVTDPFYRVAYIYLCAVL